MITHTELLDKLKNDHRWVIEHCFVIVDKHKDVVPFKFNRMQNELWDRLTNNDVVGKAGQVTSTTLFLARMLVGLLLQPNGNGIILAQDEDPFAKLQVSRMKFMLDNLKTIPFSHNGKARLYDLRAYTDKSGKTSTQLLVDTTLHLRFSNGSQLWAGSADSGSMGVSQPYHYVLSTETTRCKHQEIAETTIAAAESRIPRGEGWCVMETTAKGEGDLFHRRFTQAYYLPSTTPVRAHFFGWWWDEENSLTGDEENLIESARGTDDEIRATLTTEESQGMIGHNWTIGNIRWRRNAKTQAGFDQEHAEDPITMFMVSGSPVYDTDKMREYKARCRLPNYTADSGCYKIWFHPQPTSQYMLIADIGTGQPGSHPSAATVWKLRPFEHHASLRGLWPLDVFTKKCFDIINYYNEGLVDYDGTGGYGEGFYETMKNLGLATSRLIKHRNITRPNAIPRPGFNFNVRTKRDMIDDFIVLINTDGLVTWDDDLVSEIMSYRWNGKETGPSPGATDDLHDTAIMANQNKDRAYIMTSRETAGISIISPYGVVRR